MTSTQKRCSIYDTLPSLESWYCDVNKNTTDPIQKKKRPGQTQRNVSFSAKPPSIHYLDQDEEDEEEINEELKAIEKHLDSSQVKAFFRHCAKKLMRRHTSSGPGSVAPMY
ncbi:hypothetical protein EC973_001086 [Apophysomyces ossiformis]|uniref:Uncharacterized protein n=1 Tax=Apophysomyces ossiformis TaxID=679940 RepID=A0A8H7BQK3_9FUNG|nr:hypothetical protein EC973_001086 [Apophysomyces ossiformis]